MESDCPIVLAFAGSDPTGGAGIQADIESGASMGAHVAPVVTAVTVQDTVDVQGFMPLDINAVSEQARAILEDMPVAVFKIGLLGSVEAAEAISNILEDYPSIPVVFDPVLASGAGTSLVDSELIDAICDLLIPRTTILTPNSREARMLATEADNLEACAHELQDMGAEYVLITGTHENTEKVINSLYTNQRLLDSYEWARLPHTYHGSGCTLSAAIAALLAQGVDPMTAVLEAQEYTWQTLKYARRLGMGQYIPNRMFWAMEHEQEENPMLQ